MPVESALARTDPQMAAFVSQAEFKQSHSLAMIPSTNHTSKAVRESVGTTMDHYYSEGYPPGVKADGKSQGRYYQDQEVPNDVENLVRARARELFGVPYVNVQPLSGSPMNMETYAALLPDGATIMGLDLPSGGHLTHSSPVSAVSRLWHTEPYTTDEDGHIDYDDLERRAEAIRPELIVGGTTAYARLIDWERLRHIADKSGSILMADISHLAGLIAGGAIPSPEPYVDVITTTTHKTL